MSLQADGLQHWEGGVKGVAVQPIPRTPEANATKRMAKPWKERIEVEKPETWPGDSGCREDANTASAVDLRATAL